MADEDVGPMTPAIHAIRDRHLHEIPTPDERSFIKTWRRQLQDCLTKQNSRIASFLITQTPDIDIEHRCTELLAKFSRTSPPSYIRDLSLTTDISGAMADLESELGVHPTELRETLRRTVRLYVNTATALSTAEGQLEEKLKRLETVVSRVNGQMFLEPTPELAELAEPMRKYLDSVLDKIDIEPDFREVSEQYKRFSILKGLVSLIGFQQTSSAPTCTICMTRPVCLAMTPCGHVFCEECCRSQMTACYICRVQIRDRVRLYFN
jgi:hypothetical protein